MLKWLSIPLLLLLSPLAFAEQTGPLPILNLTHSMAGIVSVIVFVLAYLLVITEEFTHLRKSKSVILASGVIWTIIAYTATHMDMPYFAEQIFRHYLLQYGELLLFLLVAMTYINSMEERNVFKSIRSYLFRKNLTYRQLFWVTGFLSFFISPLADNMTTGLFMAGVVAALGAENPKFVSLACINVVVAANAGGVFSPFGDLTTLLIWQNGLLDIQDFISLFIPALVNFLIPAILMSLAVPNLKPENIPEHIRMKRGAKRIAFLFISTVIFTIVLHCTLRLPAVFGMMTGLGFLSFFAYYLKQTERFQRRQHEVSELLSFDIFRRIENAEWDTLLFFYGVILCVGGLATFGYLHQLSTLFYTQMGAHLSSIHQATPANILLGLLSSFIDNIPLMFSVLTMQPVMSDGQWLLVTLTTGVGGSLLSIGSAAGVALMGQTKGKYTFFSHLKWTWAIALGYFASIACHYWINYSHFLEPVGQLLHHTQGVGYFSK